jgi:hypothetical protein
MTPAPFSSFANLAQAVTNIMSAARMALHRNPKRGCTLAPN